MTTFTVFAIHGIGEIERGTDLADAVLQHAVLRAGDIVVVTSKVVSKAEGRVVTGRSKDDVLPAETDRVVARRGPTSIVRTRHGLVMAAAGIDASNTEPGTLVLLPEDPDRSARELRSRFRALSGLDVGVVVSDTSGRAWRNGQTDIAVGAAGLKVLDDHAGRSDAYGNVLAVTAPALADEIAAAGDLAKGKLTGHPVAVVRGLAALVLPAGDDGPGAAALVRGEESDMFGLGAREAVLSAVGPATAESARGLGGPAPAEVLATALATVLATGLDGLADAPATVRTSSDGREVRADVTADDPREQGRTEVRLEAVVRAHGWTAHVVDEGDRVSVVASLP